ncbi:MAG: DNA polymerase I [Chlamydiota bacterium]
MDRLYILDAVNYIFRSYYAIGPMTNPDGASTSALYGFIRSLQKVLTTFSPQYVVAVFDGPDNTKRRKEVYSAYKMHRKKAPEDLYPQIAWAYEFCEKAGIPCLCVSGVEADDTMATLALWAKKEGKQAYLCTSDKDLFQLICEEIYVINVHKDHSLIDAKKVEEIYGVPPSQMLDLLAIMGDSADNIPGLTGFGPKTGASLLKKFGTLENILAHPEEVPGKKKQETLRKEKEIALFSKELATLHTSVPIPGTWEFYQKSPPDQAKLEAFYQKMHFMTLLKECRSSEEPASEQTPPSYHILRTESAIQACLNELENHPLIAFDTETTSLNVLDARLVGIGLSGSESDVYYIPFNGDISEKRCLELLRPFFQNPKRAFISHHAKYDLHVLKNHGMQNVQIGFDTMIASYLLNPDKRKHSLDALTFEHFRKEKISWDSLFEGHPKGTPLEKLPIETVGHYCCEDVEYTWKLRKIFEKLLEEKRLDKVFYEVELPLIPILNEMERNGIFLNANRLQEQSTSLTKECDRVKQAIFAEAGATCNLNSPKQLSELLFSTMGIPRPKNAKTSTATGAKILESLANKYPIVQKILHYRMLDKLLSTYVHALPKAVHPKTGRIHSTFNQSVVATGRLSCNNPNLQNIPIRSEEGKNIRSAFCPQKQGWVYLAADYSQIELRLLAHFSQDEELLRAFHKGEDIHTYTASLVYEVQVEAVTKEMRRSAKAVNFGILYGQTGFGLAQELGIKRKEADAFIKTYFARYPAVSRYIEDAIQRAKTEGFCSTITGRKRPLLELGNKNPMIQKAAERLAVNTPLQGSAADLIKLAMISIGEKLPKVSPETLLILQVHDELIFEVPEKDVPRVQKCVQHSMEHAAKLLVPLVVDISIGKNWAEC